MDLSMHDFMSDSRVPFGLAKFVLLELSPIPAYPGYDTEEAIVAVEYSTVSLITLYPPRRK